MSPSSSSFLYLSNSKALEDTDRAGIALDAVERMVIKRESTEPNHTLRKVPGFIEESCCQECGDKLKPLDIVVLDSLFYLWHQHCYQETKHPAKAVGPYNEVTRRFGVFRRSLEEPRRFGDSTNHPIERESDNMILPL